MPKNKLFRINAEISNQLIATADLLGVDKEELLEKIISEYMITVQDAIKQFSHQYPQFQDHYPFILHPSSKH